jgi:hypothetical protein
MGGGRGSEGFFANKHKPEKHDSYTIFAEAGFLTLPITKQHLVHLHVYTFIQADCFWPACGTFPNALA